MAVGTDLTRDEILAGLKRLEPALRARGVTHLAIFGSRSRADARPDSDLDVLVDVDGSCRNPLFVAFDTQHIVQDGIGIETQATLRSDLGSRIAERIADDLIEVF
jgi:predicted nucleotidyltransferase